MGFVHTQSKQRQLERSPHTMEVNVVETEAAEGRAKT